MQEWEVNFGPILRIVMLLDKHLVKVQFKINHIPFLHRLGLLVGILGFIIGSWWYLIYVPQEKDLLQAKQQLVNLEAKTAEVLTRNASILQNIKNPDMSK